MGASRSLARAWHIAAGAGLAAFVVWALVPAHGLDDLFNRWVYNALILLAFAACLYRTRCRDAERGAWIALTVGVASWTVAEILFDFAYSGDPPYPSAAD